MRTHNKILVFVKITRVRLYIIPEICNVRKTVDTKIRSIRYYCSRINARNLFHISLRSASFHIVFIEK